MFCYVLMTTIQDDPLPIPGNNYLWSLVTDAIKVFGANPRGKNLESTDLEPFNVRKAERSPITSRRWHRKKRITFDFRGQIKFVTRQCSLIPRDVTPSATQCALQSKPYPLLTWNPLSSAFSPVFETVLSIENIYRFFTCIVLRI